MTPLISSWQSGLASIGSYGTARRLKHKRAPPGRPAPATRPGGFPPFNRSHTHASQGNPSQKSCTKITILLFHNDKQTTVLIKHYSKQSFAVSQLTTASIKEQHKELVGDRQLKYRLSSSVYPLSSFVFTFCFVLPVLPFQRRNKTLLLSEAADC